MTDIRIKLLIVAAIVSALASLFCVILLYTGSSGPKIVSNNPLACFECSKLKIQGIELLIEKLKVKKDQEGRDMCCIYNSEQVSAILSVVFSSKEKFHEMSGLVAKKKESHLARFQIPVSGLYAVYSSLHFKSETTDTQQKSMSLQHLVKKVGRDGEELVLMKGFHTSHEGRKEDEEINHQNGIFHLQAADYLILETPQHSSAILNKDSSYLGAELLASDKN